MSSRTYSFAELVENLSAATDETQLCASLQPIAEVYELRHYTYLLINLPTRTRAESHIVRSSYSEGWLNHYTKQNYFVIDPVVTAATAALLPVDWMQIDRRNPSSQRLFGEATEFGVGTHGLTVPIRGPSNDQAIFSLSGDVSDHDWRQMKPTLMRDLPAIACHVHAAVLRISAAEQVPTQPSLSPRERECLQHAARGMTNKEIAKKLNISERVVRAYFETARAKLNCHNRSHVISCAIGLGMIRPT